MAIEKNDLLDSLKKERVDRRAAVKMIRDAYDQLSKKYVEVTNHNPSAFLGLQLELKGVIEYITINSVPMDTVNEFCKEFKALAARDVDLRWPKPYWESSIEDDDPHEQKISVQQWDYIHSIIEPYGMECKNFRLLELPGLDRDRTTWSGIKKEPQGWLPDAPPIDQSPVWNEALGRHIIKDIYQVTRPKNNYFNERESRYVIFETQDIYPQMPPIYKNEEGIPRCIIDIYNARVCPVVVVKTDEGWSFMFYAYRGGRHPSRYETTGH